MATHDHCYAQNANSSVCSLAQRLHAGPQSSIETGRLMSGTATNEVTVRPRLLRLVRPRLFSCLEIAFPGRNDKQRLSP